MKMEFGLFLLFYIILFANSYHDDTHGPKDIIMLFVFSGVIIGVWFWYLVKYMGNGKILESKGMIEGYNSYYSKQISEMDGQQQMG